MQVLFFLLMTTGIEAGPNQTSCNGSVVTLQALITDPPFRYEIEWEGNPEAGPFYVVTPTQTTTYRAILRDVNLDTTWEDTVTVFVHQASPDLNQDGDQTGEDWSVFYEQWGQYDTNFDGDGNGQLDILDWFYVCNFDVTPPNTPPSYSFEETFTVSGETVIVDYQIQDQETTPVLTIAEQPSHGFVLLLSGTLRYSPEVDYVGFDTFKVQISDGSITTQPISVGVTVLEPDNWTDLYDNIFFPNCKACHIDAVSGGLSLSSYEAAQSAGGFVAGFPENSPIYQRTSDGTMPPPEFPRLSDEMIERIRLWILRGAPP